MIQTKSEFVWSTHDKNYLITGFEVVFERSFFVFVQLLQVSTSQAQQRLIFLSDDIFLSSAEIVANDQHIGLFDGAQKQFYLFDHATGEFLTKIDARDSYPGFNWFPIRPKLLQNEVFFTNSAPWGVYISYENKVTHVAERTFLATGTYDFIHDSLYVGFYSSPNGDHELRGVDRDGSPVLTFDEINIEFPNLSYRNTDSNHLLHHNGRMYFIAAFTTTLFEFDLDGKVQQTRSLVVDGFKKIERDTRVVEPGNMSALMQEFVRVTKEKSVMNGLFGLNDNELLITTYLGYPISDNYVVVNKLNLQTNILQSVLVENSDVPRFARDNKVYFVDIESEPATITIEPLKSYWSRIMKGE